MGREGAAVDLGAGAGPADALGDVEDDAREAVLVDVDLLIVGDLSEGTIRGYMYVLVGQLMAN